MDILGIGECMIELDADSGLAETSSFQCQVGGDVFNTLVAVSRLGGKAAFVSGVAMDGFGQRLIRAFQSYGIDSRGVQRFSQGYNGVYFTALDAQRQHEFVYYRHGSAASRLHPSHLSEQWVQEASVVYATGVSQAISPTARACVLKAFQLGRAQGKLTVYDPNYRSRLWVHRDHAIEAMVEILPYVDILLPSFEDLQGLLDITDLPHMLEYFQLRDVPMVALKQGTEGVTLAFRRQQHHISAIPAPVLVDTIGAGDAFNGGFLWGMLQKRSLVQCAELGVQVASLSLGGRGPIAGLPGPQELAGKALSHYVS